MSFGQLCGRWNLQQIYCSRDGNNLLRFVHETTSVLWHLRNNSCGLLSFPSLNGSEQPTWQKLREYVKWEKGCYISSIAQNILKAALSFYQQLETAVSCSLGCHAATLGLQFCKMTQVYHRKVPRHPHVEHKNFTAIIHQQNHLIF